MVLINNITMKECVDKQGVLDLFDAGNKQRRVGATNMNAESSRSHSVFSILIENYDMTTKKTSTGKLSLVDLAGSERVGKTGCTDERLKEAQAINKSLSGTFDILGILLFSYYLCVALGDVISALSTGESFIPYRNNKVDKTCDYLL